MHIYEDQCGGGSINNMQWRGVGVREGYSCPEFRMCIWLGGSVSLSAYIHLKKHIK